MKRFFLALLMVSNIAMAETSIIPVCTDLDRIQNGCAIPMKRDDATVKPVASEFKPETFLLSVIVGLMLLSVTHPPAQQQH